MSVHSQTLRELYDAVVDLAPEARADFLAAQGIEPADRERLLRMLDAQSLPGGVLPSTSAEDLEDAKRFDEARAAAESALSADEAPDQLEPEVVAQLRRIAGVRHSS